MTEHDARAELRRAVRRGAVTPSAVLAGSLVIIWAASGAGYFWPMWPALGVGIAIGLWVALHWARMQPPGASRRYAVQAGMSAVLALTVVAVWAMSGGGYFWPIYPFTGLAALLALHRAFL